MKVTDDRQTTDGRAIAYSKRELNVNVSSRSLKTKPVAGQRCPATGKVTVGLASH